MTNTTDHADLDQKINLPRLEPVVSSLCFGNAGRYVEWFQEDDTAPLGYRVAHWYGSREACEARQLQPAPELIPAREANGPHLHARAE